MAFAVASIASDLLRLFRPDALHHHRQVRLLRGDIARHSADAIAVSANPQLEGTVRSNYWRFAGRKGCDGAVQAAGGPSLASKVARLRNRIPRPLEPGSAVVSGAGGNLRARFVVHCIAPDALSRSAEEHESYYADPDAFERDRLVLLQATYAAAIDAAASRGARSLALPSIGCGVRGFPRDRAGTAAFRAAATWLRDRDGGAPAESALRRLDFVCFADDVWAKWPECAISVLGLTDAEEADATGGPSQGAQQSHTWTSSCP